jgi:hypothetical protein
VQSGTTDPNQYLGPVLPVFGAYHFCAWKRDADPRLVVLARSQYGPPEKAYGNVPIDHPGYAIRPYGKGRTAMVPWTIGRSYRELGLTVSREVIHDIVRELLAGDEIISVDLPESIEVTLHKTGDRLVVHLVNMSGARRSNFGPPVPVRDGVLRLRGAGAKATARALVSDAQCQTTTHDGTVSIALPEIDLFEVIVVDYSDVDNSEKVT